MDNDATDTPGVDSGPAREEPRPEGAGSRPRRESPNAAAREARLYIVSTPIGNLADITQRAVNILKSVPVVACENTRRSRVLLAHIGAQPRRLEALHDHNEAAASARSSTTCDRDWTWR